MKTDSKPKTLLFFVFLYVPSIALLLLVGSQNIFDYITTTFYIILAVVCLVILGTLMTSDDKYYRTLEPKYLAAAILVSLLMMSVSLGLSFELKNPNMLLAVNSMALVPSPSSTSTFILSMLVSGLVLAATSEELFKLVAFAEGKERWGKKSYGVLIYVGFPVGFWAALHGIQAYSDPVLIIPAAINGVFLIIYLWKTQCILGCIFAHWLYNAQIMLITFINGTADVPANTPFFPNIFSSVYWSNSGFIYDFVLLLVVLAALLFFLLPSLTSKRKR